MKEETRKQPYVKPEVKTIELAAEEVLGLGCKLVDGGTAATASPCPALGCAGQGS